MPCPLPSRKELIEQRNLMEEQKLIAELAIQLNKAITMIDSEWPKDQHSEMGVPAMEDALAKAIDYAERKSKIYGDAQWAVTKRADVPKWT